MTTECPNCGAADRPVETVKCAEEIRFWSCQHCDFSTWTFTDWQKRWCDHGITEGEFCPKCPGGGV